MTIYKCVDGKEIEMTPEEEADFHAWRDSIAAEQYKYERRAAYGPIEDQLDMLYRDMKALKLGLTAPAGEWYQHVDQVKKDHPKP